MIAIPKYGILIPPKPILIVFRVRRQHLNLDKALDQLGEIPDLN